MSIKNRLYKAITNEFSSPKEFSDIKTYWHECFKNFGGQQGLKQTKQDAFVSQIMGANNINTMSAHFNNNKFFTNKELYEFIVDNVYDIFPHNLWEITSVENDHLILNFKIAEIEATEDILMTYYFDFSLNCSIHINEETDIITIKFDYDIFDELHHDWHGFDNHSINNNFTFKKVLEEIFSLEVKDVTLTNSVKDLLDIEDLEFDDNFYLVQHFYSNEKEFLNHTLLTASNKTLSAITKFSNSKFERVKKEECRNTYKLK